MYIYIYIMLSRLFWFPDWFPKIESRNVVLHVHMHMHLHLHIHRCT